MTLVEISASVLVGGDAEGPVLLLGEPLSFWGGLDVGTGAIIDRWHPQHGAVVTGRVLVMPAGRGSSSGSSVLAEAVRRATGPRGIVLANRDAIVTVGAMVAAELYGEVCPVTLVSGADWPLVAAACRIAIVSRGETAILRCLKPGA